MTIKLPKFAKPKQIKLSMKNYYPKPHPRQSDIDAYRSIPSLVTGGK